MRTSRFLILALLVANTCFSFPASFEARDSSHFIAHLADGAIAELRADRVSVGGITLRFVGASAKARLEGCGPSAPATYIRSGFAETFPQFPRAAIRNLYPGVDAIFYGNGTDLEYDLQLANSASLDRVRIQLEEAIDTHIDQTGALVLRSGSGVVRHLRPSVFQQGREIEAEYVLRSNHEISFKLGKHDRRAPVTVDPVLVSTKTFGTTGPNAAGFVATDAQGNLYLAGRANGVDFPTTSSSFASTAVPSLRVLSNAGQKITGLKVANALDVGIVAATPDGRIIYAATSKGLFLSGAAGSTWRRTAPFPVRTSANRAQDVLINAISIDSLDPATILVATNVGLFGTDSGGQSWGERNTGMTVSASGFVSVSQVFYHPTNPLIAYATTSGPPYLFKSLDAGNTWQRLEPASPGEPVTPLFSFSPNIAATLSRDGSTLYAINSNRNMVKSVDAGTSWVKLAEGFNTPAYIQIDPSNPNTIYVLDQASLKKSVDGGVTFAKIATPGDAARVLALDDSGNVFVSSSFDQVLNVSTDGAKTFAVVPGLVGTSGLALSASGGRVYAGTYAPQLPFVMKLDPTGSNILYSTFLGGSLGDIATGFAVDPQGNAVLAGIMLSPDFPLTIPASRLPAPGKSNGFASKLSLDGTRLVYSIAFSSANSVSMQAVAVDAAGAAYIAGQTTLGDSIPATSNALQPTPPVPTSCTRPLTDIFGPPVQTGNSFVSKLSPDGKAAIYTTYLTGSCGSAVQGIIVDSAGDAIVVGSTTSFDFPVSANSYGSKFPAGTNPTVLDAGFIAKLAPAGDKLLASTFVGGGYSTQARAVALDTAGNAFVTGFTNGLDPSPTPGAFQTVIGSACSPMISIGPDFRSRPPGDAFVLKLDANFSTARFLTYLGASCDESGGQVALDPGGNIWVSGATSSQDFPLKEPFQGIGLFTTPGFVSQLSPDGSRLLFSSFSEGSGLAVRPGEVYLAGSSGSSALLLKIDASKSPAIAIDAIRPVVAFSPVVIPPIPSSLAPGQLIRISGRGLGPATKLDAKLDITNRLPFVLGPTVVFFDNIPAPLLSVSSTTIECIVPFEVASNPKIKVISDGQVSNEVRMSVTSSAPQVLMIANADCSVNSADHPAKAGSGIAIYVSGLGQTNPPGADGLVNQAPLPALTTQVSVFLSALLLQTPLEPQYAGAAPGLIAGISQINVQLPAGTAPFSPGQPVNLSVNGAQARLYVIP